MAEYNEIGVGRYNRMLQRLLQIKADPPTRTLGTELQPVLVIESDAPEWEYLRGGRRLACYANVAADALGPSLIRAYMPATAQVLARIRRVTISVGLTGLVRVFRGTGLSAYTPATELTRDNRNPDAASLVVSTTSGAGVAGNGDITDGFLLLANTPFVLPDSHVVAPGGSLEVIAPANTNLVVALDWSERMREESET